jgi:hypothetical protein
MKKGLTFVLGFAILLVGVVCLQADDQAATEPVTLKGTVTCAKCDLKQSDKCATVIKVTKDGKDMVYYFDKAGNKKYHGEICTSPTKGEVTGVVQKKDKDGKQTIKVSEVKLEKKS